VEPGLAPLGNQRQRGCRSSSGRGADGSVSAPGPDRLPHRGDAAELRLRGRRKRARLHLHGLVPSACRTRPVRRAMRACLSVSRQSGDDGRPGKATIPVLPVRRRRSGHDSGSVPARVIRGPPPAAAIGDRAPLGGALLAIRSASVNGCAHPPSVAGAAGLRDDTPAGPATIATETGTALDDGGRRHGSHRFKAAAA